MPKLNIMALPRPERPEETRTFSDPAQPGAELVLTFRALDLCRQAVAEEEAARLAATYAVNWFPMPNGPPVQVTEGIAQSACLLAAMQVAEPEERYSPEEWIAMMANMPTAFQAVLTWAGELSARAQQSGN
jgi:hypothetical protein